MFKSLRYIFFLPLILVAMLGYGQPPAITSFSPATGPVGTLVTINGTNLSTPTAFTIGGKSAIVVSNTGSVLVGMVMPGAATGAVAITTAGGTASGSGNFTVTATPFPSAQQGAKLVGTGSIGDPEQGYSVSLSADGNTAIVGGYVDNSSQGAAWVYTRSGGAWAQQGPKLVGTGSVGSKVEQGYCVSLSADGNTAIVGGIGDNSFQGAAWIFTRSDGTWTQQGSKLVGTGSTGTLVQQGSSVSLSADGNTAIVGAWGDNSGVGAAWVYTRSGGTWAQQGLKLLGAGSAGAAQQGVSVSLSADGNTAIVGGDGDNSLQGAVWVYIRSNGGWAQQGPKLVGTGSVGGTGQGISVSLSADGNTAIAGGGTAWVFTRSGNTWSQQGSMLAGVGGFSVALSADGNTAIVGGSTDNSHQGAAWVFTRSGGVWTQKGPKLVGTGNVGTPVFQGNSVALSADGNTAIAGGYGDNSWQGAAWVYIVAQPPTIISFSPAVGTPGTLVTINGTNLSTATAFTIGGKSAIVVSNTGSVLVGMVMPGAATGAVAITTTGGTASGGANFTVMATPYPSMQQGAKLVGTGGIATPEQGYSIALSADGNTAIVGGYDDNSGYGAAWVYTRSGSTWAQQGSKLIAVGSATGFQGCAVALSADGNTAIVGGYNDNGTGAAWVYTRSGSAWSQQGRLMGTGNYELSQQGISVSLSADGNTAIVGGFDNNLEVWAALVYTRSGTAWIQQGTELAGSDYSADAQQGISVSLSADGNTAIVGGYNDNSGQGAAWVYTRSGEAWTQQGAKLVGTGNTGASAQGRSVCLSADGNTAIVGGSADNSGAGAVWIFTRIGSAWVQQGAKLVGTGSTGAAAQGWSVALSADGNTAVVGGNADNSGVGATWVYTRSGNSWTQKGAKLVGTGGVGTQDQGYSAALSADGNTAFVGGIADNSSVGAAWAFITPSTNANLANLKISSGTLTPAFATGTTSYTVSVPAATTSVTVTPTTTDPNATVTVAVNGGTPSTVTSGTASGSLALNTGTNTIITKVTAQDGTTIKTYTITVGRGASNAYLSHISISSGTLKPVTGSPNYTDAVINAATSVTVTPTTTDPNATVTVNGVSVVSGTASAAIPLNVGTNAVNMVVTAQDGVTTQPYVITVTRAPSSNAYLSHLAISSGTLKPVTGSPNYTVSVTSATTSVKVTATTADPTATLTINGTAVASGTPSAAIPINVGTNAINIVVTAQDGTTTQPYVITVTRPSNNAYLSHISISSGTLTPVSGTPNYTVSVANTVTSVTVTPTTTDPNATVKVNGTTVTSGTASAAIPLNVGANTINIVVTAQDGTTLQPYVITVTRAKSSNAYLSHLAISSGTLTPVTGSPNYTDAVTNATTSVKVTATTADPNATLKINGTTVAPGTASPAIPLNVGTSAINIVVTAQDGITTQSYVITVTRATGPLMSLYQQISVVQPADSPTIENDGVTVHQGVSPNGDGINDFLTIDGIIAYPDNSLQVIDRNGTLVFQAKGYNNIANVFDGHSGINGRLQQPGTYFYLLDYVADGQRKHKTGFILLKY